MELKDKRAVITGGSSGITQEGAQNLFFGRQEVSFDDVAHLEDLDKLYKISL